MRGAFASWNPATSWHDRVFQQFLIGGEQIQDSSFGAQVLRGAPPRTGKVYCTNFRLAFVPDKANTITASSAWVDIVSLQMTHVSKLTRAATVECETKSHGEINVDTTKPMARQLEQTWLLLKDAVFDWETTEVSLEPQVHVLCRKCRAQVPPAAFSCRYCLSRILWPNEVQAVVDLAQRADGVLPTQLPNGQDSQASFLASGMATLAVAAACKKESGVVRLAEEWANSLLQGVAVPSSNFGEFPRFSGVGDPENNVRLWKFAAGLPTRLFGGN